MEKRKFLDIKNYTRDSLQYGFQNIEEIIQAASVRSKEGYGDHVFLTEDTTLFSAPEFLHKAREKKLIPVIGLTVHVLNNLSKEVLGTITFYAKNDDGYESLVKILAQTEKLNGQQCITLKNLRNAEPKDLKVLIGGPNSLLHKFIKDTFSEDPAIKEIGEKLGSSLVPFLKTTFGANNINYEIQPPETELDARINNVIRKMAAKQNIPVIPTFDIRANSKNDMPLLMNKGKSLVLNKDEQYDYQKTLNENGYRDFFNEIDFEKHFSINELNNLHEFGLDFKGDYSLLPDDIYVPESSKDLKETAFDSLEKIIEGKTDEEKEVYRQRLNHEYEIINSLGFNDYFLIFDDIVKNVKDANFMLRGSSIGSLMTYVLGLSNADPIEHGLLFERFLNKGRAGRNEYPDVDLETDKISEIQSFLKERYGSEGVFLMTDRESVRSKSSIMFVKDAFGMSDSFQSEDSRKRFQNACFTLYEPISKKKYFKAGEGSLKDEIVKYPDFVKLINNDPYIKGIVKLAFKVEEQTTGFKKSPSSYVIVPKEKRRLYSESALLPNTNKGGESILKSLEISKHTAPLLGLVKLDILSNVVLGHLNKLLTERKDIKISPKMDDPKAYNVLSSGMSFGIFQLSKQAKLCEKVQPKNFDDLVSIMALMRPGISQETRALFYKNRKKGSIDSIHPLLDNILKGTNGAILFDEQIMLIAQNVAGYSPDESDNFRSLLKSNKIEKLHALKPQFIEGGMKKGLTLDAMEKVFDTIEQMCGKYTFNKAHAIAYATVAYQQAYIANYYPAEYFSSFVLTDTITDDKKAVGYTHENVIQKLNAINGFKLRFPKPNEVFEEFRTIDENSQKIGVVSLSTIVTPATFDAIKEAKDDRPFVSFPDFVKRTLKTALNSRSSYSFEVNDPKKANLVKNFIKDIESLIKVGVFDHSVRDIESIVEKRSALNESLHNLMNHIKEPYIHNYEPLIKYEENSKHKFDISSIINEEVKLLYNNSPTAQWIEEYALKNKGEEESKNEERRKLRQNRALEIALQKTNNLTKTNVFFDAASKDLENKPSERNSNFIRPK